MPELTPLDDNRQEHFLNGEDLEPITRREHFYAGRESELPAGHQEPETREEWFIQKYRGGGGDVTVVPLSVTDNGTYSEEGKAYSPVSVNVPLPQNAYLLKSVANLPQAIASFNDGEEMVMPSLKVAIEPQQEGSGEPSPTNVRPISGWDKVDVTRCGKNLFSYDLPIRDGYWASETRFQGSNNIVTKDNAIGWQYIRLYVEGLSQITLSSFDVQGGTLCAWLGSEDVSDIISTFNSAEKNGTKTVPQGAKYICLVIYSIKTKSESYPNAQLELGTTATTYSPYNGQTYTIDLDGTHYGGKLDVVSGVLTVDRVYKKFDGTDTTGWRSSGTYGISSRFDNQSIIGKPLGSIISNMFVKSTVGNDKECISLHGSDGFFILLIHTDRLATNDVAGLMNYFSSNNLEICYELATPITVQLAPTQVKSLLGVNNIWADTGDITDAEYFSKEG